MKPKQRNPIKLSTTLGAMLLSSMLLAACGGGGGGSAAVAIINAGIGGTGIVFGTITGFGSVWVNGRRFEIDASEIIVDGEIKTEADLKIGMVVRLDVDTDANGMFVGAATKVEFDDAIQGPINGPPSEVPAPGSGVKQFEILGQNVTIDATRTLFEGTDFDYTTITDGDVVEVSGFRKNGGEIVATYVREITVPPLNKVELRGEVIDLDLVPGTFKIYDVEIKYTGVIPDVDGGLLANGMFVEVEGTFVSHTKVDAVKIEQEDEDFGADVDEIDLQGVVSQYVSIADSGPGLANFFVSGQRVNALNAKLEPADLESLMQDGLEVEVEGEIDNNGVLMAEELELRVDTKLRATVFSKNLMTSSFVVEFPVATGIDQVTVNTSGQTLFEDDTDPPVTNFSLVDLLPGDFVEVEGVEINGAAGVTVGAHTVERRDVTDIKLQGAVDAIDSGTPSITILGIIYPMAGTAIYEEGAMTEADFFKPSNLMVGDIVELEDNNSIVVPADGLADAAEIDD